MIRWVGGDMLDIIMSDTLLHLTGVSDFAQILICVHPLPSLENGDQNDKYIEFVSVGCLSFNI